MGARETRAAAKKSLDREGPFSLALRVVSLLSCPAPVLCLQSRARSFACLGRFFLDGQRKKRDCS